MPQLTMPICKTIWNTPASRILHRVLKRLSVRLSL